MVEFALVLPLWLMILALIVMTAWIGYLQIRLERAAFEGAKAGAVFKDDREAMAKARAQETVPALELTSVDVTVQDLPFPNGRITVVAGYDWTAPFTFGLPASFPLRATAVAALEP